MTHHSGTTRNVKIVKNFPHKIKEDPNLWIALRDGTRLAARIWMPQGAEQRPVPAILEYLRKQGTV